MQSWQVYSYTVLDSTMDKAASLLQEGLPLNSRIAIFAEQQQLGRGRYGREWASPQGNLYLSLLCQPSGEMKEWAQISFIACVAVLDFLKIKLETIQPRPHLALKWPNDVLVNNQKISGILLEVHHDLQGKPWLITGIGINLTSAPIDTPYPATFLKKYNQDESIYQQDQHQLLECFDRQLVLWQDYGFESIRRRWLEHAAHIGKTMQIRLPQQEIEGRFVDLDKNGCLVLEQKDNSRLTVSAGEVYLL